MVTSETDTNCTVITLQPNRSANWAQTRFFLCLLCGTTLSVGIFLALMGAWAVLPFSGLEAGLLAWVMYRVSYRSYQLQRISISEQQVLIQLGVYFPRQSWRLQRASTYLAVIESHHPLDPPDLSIFDTEYNVEIGSFLNRADKEKALAALKKAGIFVRSHDKLAHIVV